ncbi:MAG: thioredoxin domain-containing protein [Gemmatimonadota bacterium]
MNRLSSATSAYLKSAAHQPVHWYPWGDAAFEDAKQRDRPILLDIGAVWCHWCHVMDGESYENPELAEFLNQNFVCVKVDRDERPDLDIRYQRAVQSFTGQGGWPLTAFLTTTGDVFYGGTYFPPDGRYGRPGFRTVLDQILVAFHQKRDQVARQSAAVRDAIAQTLDEAVAGPATEELIERAVSGMERIFDLTNGGFGTAPKFPHPAAVELLLSRWCDKAEPRVRKMIELKLLAMARGGIRDHLGGGFHRYSTDAQWIVPHFEKMSYDNSELLRAYLGAWSVFEREEFREAAAETVRFVRDVLADEAGGYAASQDADVGLEDDGDYFTWTADEARAVLTPAEFDVAAAYYDIGTAGEMHHNPGKNVLFIATTPDAISVRASLPESEVMTLLHSAQVKLRETRASRPTPFIDRTRYTSWNAMMAGAMLKAGVMLGDRWAHQHALKTLERIRAENPSADAVTHSPGGLPDLLEDQVQAALAAIDAAEVTGDDAWLDWSESIMERVWRDYWDPARGGFFDSKPEVNRGGLLAMRSKPVQDAPTPSPNGVAGIVLARLAEHTMRPEWIERRDTLIAAFAGGAAELGLHGATFLTAVDWQLHPSVHLVIVGAAGDQEADRMHQRALATWLPRRVVRRLAPDQLKRRALPPAMAGMIQPGAGARAYACIGASCRLPVSKAAEWDALLREIACIREARVPASRSGG